MRSARKTTGYGRAPLHPHALLRLSPLSALHAISTSLRATVMPPPVSGCRMFQLSPIRMAPARWAGAAVSRLLGMHCGSWDALAARNIGRTQSGIWGAMTSVKYDRSPPSCPFFSRNSAAGMSTSTRVSVEEI